MEGASIDESIEELAAAWLAAERRSTSDPAAGKATAAVIASRRFEDAIRVASQEEIRLAWEAARGNQAACETGSVAWAEARTVSELLRMEYMVAADRG
jgi:hypothetical protein